MGLAGTHGRRVPLAPLGKGTQFQAISAALEPAAQTVLQQLMQASWQ